MSMIYVQQHTFKMESKTLFDLGKGISTPGLGKPSTRWYCLAKLLVNLCQVHVFLFPNHDHNRQPNSMLRIFTCLLLDRPTKEYTDKLQIIQTIFFDPCFRILMSQQHNPFMSYKYVIYLIYLTCHYLESQTINFYFKSYHSTIKFVWKNLLILWCLKSSFLLNIISHKLSHIK